MLAIVLAVICAAALIKLGAWRRWREFYPTILYLIVGNFAYFYVFSNYKLWSYHSFMGHAFCGLILVFFVYPSAVMLYLAHCPQSRFKQAVYIIIWSAVCTLIEAGAQAAGGISYHNGWNLACSLALFVAMFVLLRLHYTRPLIVWPASLAYGVAVSLIFGLPFPP